MRPGKNTEVNILTALLMWNIQKKYLAEYDASHQA